MAHPVIAQGDIKACLLAWHEDTCTGRTVSEAVALDARPLCHAPALWPKHVLVGHEAPACLRAISSRVGLAVLWQRAAATCGRGACSTGRQEVQTKSTLPWRQPAKQARTFKLQQGGVGGAPLVWGCICRRRDAPKRCVCWTPADSNIVVAITCRRKGCCAKSRTRPASMFA